MKYDGVANRLPLTPAMRTNSSGGLMPGKSVSVIFKDVSIAGTVNQTLTVLCRQAFCFHRLAHGRPRSHTRQETLEICQISQIEINIF